MEKEKKEKKEKRKKKSLEHFVRALTSSSKPSTHLGKERRKGGKKGRSLVGRCTATDALPLFEAPSRKDKEKKEERRRSTPMCVLSACLAKGGKGKGGDCRGGAPQSLRLRQVLAPQSTGGKKGEKNVFPVDSENYLLHFTPVIRVLFLFCRHHEDGRKKGGGGERGGGRGGDVY